MTIQSILDIKTTKYKKNYSDWHKLKTTINELVIVPHCYEREVWWASIGTNVGFEEDGKGLDFLRPILIVKKFSYRFVLGLPLSATNKDGQYYYQLLSSPRFKTALLSQVRAFDTKRFSDYMGRVSAEDMKEIKGRLSELIGS